MYVCWGLGGYSTRLIGCLDVHSDGNNVSSPNTRNFHNAHALEDDCFRHLFRFDASAKSYIKISWSPVQVQKFMLPSSIHSANE